MEATAAAAYWPLLLLTILLLLPTGICVAAHYCWPLLLAYNIVVGEHGLAMTVFVIGPDYLRGRTVTLSLQQQMITML